MSQPTTWCGVDELFVANPIVRLLCVLCGHPWKACSVMAWLHTCTTTHLCSFKLWSMQDIETIDSLARAINNWDGGLMLVRSIACRTSVACWCPLCYAGIDQGMMPTPGEPRLPPHLPGECPCYS